MTKSKKLAIKESEEKKDLSIPRIPDTLFVVELDSHILITGLYIEVCVFPLYMFDCQSQDSGEAFKAAEELSLQKGKLIADTVELGFIHDPHIYDPAKFIEQMKRLGEVILAERALLRESWIKLAEEQKE